jgi:mannose-6-phosphate isomerase-like protein (cupin superfamily)
MRLTRYADAPGYAAALHEGVAARRLQGHEAGPTSRFWVGLSTYEPGGAALSAAAREETIYVVLEGELEVACGGEVVTLRRYDSVHLDRGEIRRIDNRGGDPALLLVAIALP